MTRKQRRILNKKSNGKTSKEGLKWSYKDKDMNNDTYILRTQVMSVIYDLKQSIPNLPRVEIRISDMVGASGLGWFGQNVIRISSKYCNHKSLRNIVYHELGHAVLGLSHNEDCPLMASGTKELSCHNISSDEGKRIFIKLYNNQ